MTEGPTLHFDLPQSHQRCYGGWEAEEREERRTHTPNIFLLASPRIQAFFDSVCGCGMSCVSSVVFAVSSLLAAICSSVVP